MIIQQTSLDAFKQMAITAFEDEMVEHCKSFSPTICGALSKKALQMAVHQGVEQARTWGFTRRGSVQFHLDCMLLFGSEFATDPQYPWITAVLARNDFEEELHKSEVLFEAVKAYLDEVTGSESRYVRGCLRRLLRELEGDLPVQQETFALDMARIFEELHPEKTQTAGSLAIDALVQHATERARDEYGFTGTRSVAVLAILMWFSGYRCDEDPFRPWIREALVSATLEKRAVVYFETYLQELV